MSSKSEIIQYLEKSIIDTIHQHETDIVALKDESGKTRQSLDEILKLLEVSNSNQSELSSLFNNIFSKLQTLFEMLQMLNGRLDEVEKRLN